MDTSRSPSQQNREKSRVPDCDPPSATCTPRRTPDQVEADDDLDMIFSVMKPVGYAAFNRSEGHFGDDQLDSPKLRSRLRYLVSVSERSEDRADRSEETDSKKRRWDDVGDISDVLDPVLSETPMLRGKENRPPTLRERLRSLPPGESRLWAGRYLKHARGELWELLHEIKHERALERHRRRYPPKEREIPYPSVELTIEGSDMPPDDIEMAMDGMEEGEVLEWT